MSNLGKPFQLKRLELKNKIVMAPMCQYSAEGLDGMPTDWHYVHYVSRAVGGTGLILIEMTNVEPDGRISDRCLGLWSDEHADAFARIVRETHKYGAKIGIQIAHAGRKAEDALDPVSPSGYPAPNRKGNIPRALTTAEADAMIVKFQDAARRAVAAGFDTIELHGAHGYLIHQFHSPTYNRRDDVYGDYAKFGTDAIRAVRAVMPDDMPLIMRVSAIEHADEGYELPHMIDICRKYREAGVDAFHVSSGGDAAMGARVGLNTRAPGYQVPFARAIREALRDVPVIAVGNLDNPKVAEATLGYGDADLIAVGRGMLRDPYWALHALRELGDQAAPVRQYERGY